MKALNVPQRRCVGCMESKTKDELDRYTKLNGEMVIDNLKTYPGRGVYVCKDSTSCLEKAKKRRRI